MSPHKTLSYALNNAIALSEAGHSDVAEDDINRAIYKYDLTIAENGIKRHYPTYGRAVDFSWDMIALNDT